MLASSSKSTKERTRNAYLLFYERKKFFDQGTLQELASGHMYERSLEQAKANSYIIKEIEEDNLKFFTIKYTFDREYASFLLRYMTECATRKMAAIGAFRLGITYFLTTVVRAKEKELFVGRFVRLAKAQLAQSAALCEWLVKGFANKKIIKEMLIDAHDEEMRALIAGLLRIAIHVLYEHEVGKIGPTQYAQQSIVLQFANLIVECLMEFRSKNHTMARLLMVLYQIAIAGENNLLYLMQHQFVGKLLSFLIAAANDAAAPKTKGAPVQDAGTTAHAGELPSAKGKTADLGELGEPSSVQPSKCELKSIEEVRESIKEKHALEHQVGNFSYGMKTLAIILCRIKFISESKTSSPYQKSPSLDPGKLEPEEKSLLFAKSTWQVLLGCTACSTQKLARNALATIIGHLAFKNEGFTKDVFETIEADLPKHDSFEILSYTVALSKLCAIQDDMTEWRVQKTPIIMLNAFKQNVAFLHYSDLLLSAMIKLCTKNPLVRGCFAKQKDVIKQYVEPWIRDYQNTVALFQANRVKFLKKNQPQLELSYLQSCKDPDSSHP
jgi:hypothetical protein